MMEKAKEDQAKKMEEEKKRLQEEVIQKRLEKDAQRKKEREEFLQRCKEGVKGKPLFQQYEERYRDEIELPQLENKKRQLEEIRNFRKPINRAAIEEHKQKYE